MEIIFSFGLIISRSESVIQVHFLFLIQLLIGPWDQIWNTGAII